MSQRVSYYEIAPDGMKIMMDMENTRKRRQSNENFVSLLKFVFLKLTAVHIV